MKAVILGDVHFGCGYSIGKIIPYTRLNSRLIDYSNTFNYVIDYMINNDIYNLIIAGDIFENRRPQASELSLFSEKIRRLEEYGINTHIVIGNHDLIIEQKTTTVDVLQKLKLPRTFIYSNIENICCSNGKDFLNFVFLPYRTKYMLNCNSNEEAVRKLEDRLQYEVKKISNNGLKILVGHMMLQGTRLGDIVLGNNDSQIVLPLNIFSGFDAVVMGHIHSYQVLQEEPLIIYIGSMEKKDFGDGESDKFFLIVDCDNNNLNFNFEKLPVRSLYDISINEVLPENGEEAVNYIIDFLNKYNNNTSLFDSIVRLTIFLNEKILFEFDKDKIINYLKRDLKVNNCLNIHIHTISNRQLRKNTITEKRKPSESFLEYLDFIKDENLKNKMKEIGLKMIEENL